MVKNIFSRVFVLLIYLLQSDHTGYSGMQNIEGQDWWLEEELEGSLWKSGWEKRNWAMQSAVGTHPYKEMSSIPDLFRRGEKERELGVILKFPIWTARQMVVQYTDGKHRRSWLQESEWWGQCCDVELSVSLRYSRAAQCYEVYQAGAWVGSLSWRKRWRNHLHKKSVIEAIIMENVAWGI